MRKQQQGAENYNANNKTTKTNLFQPPLLYTVL